MRALACAIALFLAACGPQLDGLEAGETSRAVRAFNGDMLVLESGLRVFLAEIDAPRGEQDYASQANAELEALALHREVLLAYGGERRWIGRPREGESTPPPEAALAHVFVKSEGGRWFWLQHELVARGAAFVRPRHDNHARSAQLASLERQARASGRGLWARRAWRTLDAREAAAAALEANANCTRGAAPYRLVEMTVAAARVFERRAQLDAESSGPDQPPFSIVVFGDAFTAWNGADLGALTGARVTARGPLGVYRQAPQLCLEHAAALEVSPG